MSLLIVSIAAFTSIAVGVAIKMRRSTPTPESVVGPSMAKTPVHRPALYCDFYDLMRKNVVVSFNFDVETRDPKRPVFSETYVIEPDNTRVDFGTPEMPSPTWTYAIDDGTPTIVAANAETRIVLYGLRPDASGIAWIEAGVRSNRYRNLEGKCRQAYFAY